MQDTGQRWSQVKAQAKRERIYKKKACCSSGFQESGLQEHGPAKFELYKKSRLCKPLPCESRCVSECPRVTAAGGKRTANSSLPCKQSPA